MIATQSEYVEAMRRYSIALRRGNRAEAKDWLEIAERHLRIASIVNREMVAEYHHTFFLKAAPHRLKLLAARASFAG